MLTSGDVIELDLGRPEGREAGYLHPAVIVTAQRILDAGPRVIHVVPLTSTPRGFAAEVSIIPDEANGLDHASSAQCQHLRAVSVDRLTAARGTIGHAALTEIRELIGVILDI